MEENIKYYFEKTCPKDESKLKHGIGIKEILYSNKEFFKVGDQTGTMKIEVLDTYAYGKTLAIDGIVQTSQADEFIYHETIAHLPLIYHNNPKKILIIGGGDGGALREVLKHNIDKVTMVEISNSVIESCKKYIPSIPNGAFENPKTNLIIGDGKKFIEKNKNKFDVIILDLSDPEGPAQGLISKNFYKNVSQALKEDGIVSIQSESLTYQPKLVKVMQENIRGVFPFVKLHTANIPTYQGSVFGISVASKKDFTKIKKQKVKEKIQKINNLKYLDEEVFFASTVIPKYLKNKIKL
ncbi:polyamine aminopropyltransferase [Candidatus Dependentiae bacterium]|nr:polyamine aminopropyltransferase [Candidatus Dependentiae bacterium]